MPFTSFLDARLVNENANEGRGEWLLLAPLCFTDTKENDYVVPAGFVSDLASVPRRPIVFLLAGCTAHRPAVLHDWLIRTEQCPREQADELFREAMESIGMKPSLVRQMYNAVRAHTENLARRLNPWSDA